MPSLLKQTAVFKASIPGKYVRVFLSTADIREKQQGYRRPRHLGRRFLGFDHLAPKCAQHPAGADGRVSAEDPTTVEPGEELTHTLEGAHLQGLTWPNAKLGAYPQCDTMPWRSPGGDPGIEVIRS